MACRRGTVARPGPVAGDFIDDAIIMILNRPFPLRLFLRLFHDGKLFPFIDHSRNRRLGLPHTRGQACVIIGGVIWITGRANLKTWLESLAVARRSSKTS